MNTNATTRRQFLQSSLTLGAGLVANSTPIFAQTTETKTTQIEPEGFFTLGERKGHWWLITPAGEPFFTMGLNHIDPASLRYPENIDIWRKKYGGSTIRWIKESVAPNLKGMGLQHRRLGSGSDCQTVAAFPAIHDRRVSRARHAILPLAPVHRIASVGEAYGPLRFPQRRLEGMGRLCRAITLR